MLRPAPPPTPLATRRASRTELRSAGAVSCTGRGAVMSAAPDRTGVRSTQLGPARLVAARRADSWVDKPGSRTSMGCGGAAPEEARPRSVPGPGPEPEGCPERAAVGGHDLDRVRQVGGIGAVEESALR